MESAQFQKLVAEIAEEILLRLKPAPSMIAKLIDHTLLAPGATDADIRRLCEEARRYGFAAVCVNPCRVALAASELDGTDVKVATVVGFPLGAATTPAKMFEAEGAVRAGAREIDMVLNIGALRSGDYDAVKRDVRGVVEIARGSGAIVKVILETALIDDAQKTAACGLAKAAGARFVKTSTGFGPAGATAHDVELMRRAVGEGMGVKAAGGVRTLDDVHAMVKAGANRIGTSAGVRIMEAASR